MNEQFVPEFSLYLGQIRSESVKKAVVAIWADLYEQSEWNSIYDVPSELNAASTTLVQHTCNVTSYAIELANVYTGAYSDKGLQVNMDNLIAGALLHDVSKLLEFYPTSNGNKKTLRGTLFVENFFGVNQVLAKDLPFEILHIIVSDATKTRTPPATTEALLVYFCDRIDMDIRNLKAGRPLRAKDSEYNIVHRY